MSQPLWRDTNGARASSRGRGMVTKFIKDDFVRVRTANKNYVLVWGDPVEVIGRDGRNTRVRIRNWLGKMVEGAVRGRLPTQDRSVLKFSMVDVQQGDGMVMETPEGKVILIDGGDNQLFARYLAARYRGSTKTSPQEIDCIIITHGDADHFAGLSKIHDSETDSRFDSGRNKWKRIFIYPKRVYHNGLVKGPSSLKVEKIFGRTVKTSDGRAAVDLVDDIRGVAKSKMNRPFKRWKRALDRWAKHGPIKIQRLAFGDKREFQFLQSEGIHVDVYGPIPRSAKVGNKRRPGLPLLRTPPKTVELPLHDDEDVSGRSFSASHTVNGHSVSLRIRFGNVRFMLTGDLNQESMELLRKKVRQKDLEAEIIKAPHHGSADFDLRALKAMKPVVSLISSGDESSRKEHIHPRATLMGALGQVSRGDISLVFCTELAAFFEMRGVSRVLESGKTYFGFERTNFGIIQIRTDGERVLVFTHSGKEEMKEAYRFTVDAQHGVKFAKDVKKR